MNARVVVEAERAWRQSSGPAIASGGRAAGDQLEAYLRPVDLDGSAGRTCATASTPRKLMKSLVQVEVTFLCPLLHAIEVTDGDDTGLVAGVSERIQTFMESLSRKPGRVHRREAIDAKQTSLRGLPSGATAAIGENRLQTHRRWHLGLLRPARRASHPGAWPCVNAPSTSVEAGRDIVRGLVSRTRHDRSASRLLPRWLPRRRRSAPRAPSPSQKAI